MVGKFKIDVNDWLVATWQKQQVDVSYISSYHIDELLVNSVKAQWINDSLDMLDVLERKLKEVNKKDLIILLVFTLNRSRRKDRVLKWVDDSCFDKTDVPPEFYLVRKKYNDFFSYIEERSQKIILENTFFQMKEVYYMERWDHGFDRYLWVY